MHCPHTWPNASMLEQGRPASEIYTGPGPMQVVSQQELRSVASPSNDLSPVELEPCNITLNPPSRLETARDLRYVENCISV